MISLFADKTAIIILKSEFSIGWKKGWQCAGGIMLGHFYNENISGYGCIVLLSFLGASFCEYKE